VGKKAEQKRKRKRNGRGMHEWFPRGACLVLSEPTAFSRNRRGTQQERGGKEGEGKKESREGGKRKGRKGNGAEKEGRDVAASLSISIINPSSIKAYSGF